MYGVMKCEMQESDGGLSGCVPADADPPGSVHPLTRLPTRCKKCDQSLFYCTSPIWLRRWSPASTRWASSGAHLRSHLCEIEVTRCSESHERCLHFFQLSNLWDALHMSSRLCEKFDASRLEDFIANTLGYLPTAHCRVLTPTVRSHSLLGGCPEAVSYRSVRHWTGKGDLE